MCHTPEEVLIKSSSSSKLNRRLLWGLLLRAGDDYVVKLMALSLSFTFLNYKVQIAQWYWIAVWKSLFIVVDSACILFYIQSGGTLLITMILFIILVTPQHNISGIGNHFPIWWPPSPTVFKLLPHFCFSSFCSCASLHYWECKSSVQDLTMILWLKSPAETLTVSIRAFWLCSR